MDEQIAFALRQADSGTLVEKICRKFGVSEPTFCCWKETAHAGLGLVGTRRLKQLEEENTRLRRLVADLSLDEGDVAGCSAPKVVEACRASRCSGGSAERLPGQRAAGLPGYGVSSIFAAVSLAPGSSDRAVNGGEKPRINGASSLSIQHGVRHPVVGKSGTVPWGSHCARTANPCKRWPSATAYGGQGR